MLLPVKRPKREPFEIAKPIIKRTPETFPVYSSFFRKIILPYREQRDMVYRLPQICSEFPGPPIRPAREITAVVTGQTDIVTELIGIVVATYSFVCPAREVVIRAGLDPGLPMIARILRLKYQPARGPDRRRYHSETIIR